MNWDERTTVKRSDLIEEPLHWQKLGMTYSANGYGAKVPTPYKIRHDGRIYRIYVTIYSNSGTAWIGVKGKKIIVDVEDLG